MATPQDVFQSMMRNVKLKAQDLVSRADRDKNLPGFQLAQGGLGNRINQAVQSYQARPSNQIAKTLGQAARPALEAAGTFGNLAYQSLFTQPSLNRQMRLDTQKALEASNRALQAAKAAREAGRPDVAAQYTRSMIPQLQAESARFTQAGKEAEAKRNALISSGIRTGLYTSAAARLPASIGAGAVGAGLNAAFGGQTSPEQIARSFGESFKYGGFPNLAYKGGLLARSLAGGAQNLAEDVAYAKLVEGRNLTPREAIISAATPGAFEAISQFSRQVRKSMPKEVVEKVDPSGLMYNKAGQLFDPINGRWAKNTKEARLAAKNTKDFIASGGVPVKAGTRLVKMSDGKWVDESLIDQYKSEIDTPKLSVEPTGGKNLIAKARNQGGIGDINDVKARLLNVFTFSESDKLAIRNAQTPEELAPYLRKLNDGSLAKFFNSGTGTVEHPNLSKPLSVEPTNPPERVQRTLDAIKEGRLVNPKRYAEAMRWQEGAGKVGEVRIPESPARIGSLETPLETGVAPTDTLQTRISGKPPGKPQARLKSPSSSQPIITLKDIETKLYGSESRVTPVGDKKSVGLIGDQLRRLEQGVSDSVSRGLESPNPVIRTLASWSQDLIGGAGKSADQIAARRQYRGGIDYGTKVATDAQNHIYNLVGKNKDSLERVHAVLDPEISKIKVKESDLNIQEKEAVATLRIMSDFINDTNYSLGKISKEQWSKNRGGKYIARAYEDYDYPPEVADFVTNKGLKFDLDPFKKRGEVNEWKIEESIKDPAYLMAKRMQQTLFNVEVGKYMDWAKQSGLASDTAKPGFIQLSDSKAYGDLAGKYIRKDALEDVKGFFATNDVAQKAYDILNWYDRNPLRKGQKMIKTVFNPAVRLGNRTGNYVFAWLNGINPVSFEKNRQWANKAIKSNDPLYRWAAQQGIMGTDVVKSDIAKVSAELSRGIKDESTARKLVETIKESYGRVDDESKLAALKTWIDRGVDPAEAVNRVSRGFQDYNMVGMLYDIGAKIPVLGNPFVRFASESLRIAKNAAVDHPIRTIASLAGWKLFTDVMSRISNETPEDREVREKRVGAGHIPFTDISTNIQTPWGEVNVSRLLGFAATYTPEDATLADASRYSPILNPLDKRSYGADPLIGPLISLGTDTDFRGKSIADPDKSKYMESTLTPGEQNLNRLGYLARAYTPPTATDVYNVSQAAQGEENVYGQKKSTLQALARVYPGVKIEKFGPEEAEKRRSQDAYFEELKNDKVRTQIRSVEKARLKGEITPIQAEKRIRSLEKGMTNVEPTDTRTTYQYIRPSDGDMVTIDIGKVSKMPESTEYEKLKKQKEAFKLVDDILDNLEPEQQAEALNKLGISASDAEYYNIARQTNDLKYAYVQDQIASIAKVSKDRNDFIKFLIEGRKEINGKMIISNGLIDDLYDANLITADEKKKLKNFTYNPATQQYEMKSSGRGSGARLSQIKPINRKMVFRSGKELVSSIRAGSPLTQESLERVKLGEGVRLKMPTL